MNIIIFGQMGAGKDTVAKLIEALLPDTFFLRYGLGDSIRATVNATAPEAEDKRALYQKYGQSMREIFGENYWSETLLARMQAVENTEDAPVSFLIPDGRQMDELEFWSARGFLTIGVKADDEVRATRLMARDGVDQRHRFAHETEVSASECVAGCHYIIDNSGDVETLVDSVVSLLTHVLSGGESDDSEIES